MNRLNSTAAISPDKSWSNVNIENKNKINTYNSNT